MQWYAVQLKAKTFVAAGTLEITLERPAGFTFTAGQFVKIRIPDAGFPGTESDRARSMSIASAPWEEDIKLVMRVPDQPSPFKRHLTAAQPGTAYEIAGPLGHFTLHADTKRPAVCVAGGIGITPFRSILLQEQHEPGGREILLLYSNRDIESAAYFDELRALAMPGYRQACTMTRMAPEAAAAAGCDTGHIDAAYIARHAAGLKNPVYYIVGLPDMVITVRRQLIAAGVPPEDVKIEPYPGYAPAGNN